MSALFQGRVQGRSFKADEGFAWEWHEIQNTQARVQKHCEEAGWEARAQRHCEEAGWETQG